MTPELAVVALLSFGVAREYVVLGVYPLLVFSPFVRFLNISVDAAIAVVVCGLPTSVPATISKSAESMLICNCCGLCIDFRFFALLPDDKPRLGFPPLLGLRFGVSMFDATPPSEYFFSVGCRPVLGPCVDGAGWVFNAPSSLRLTDEAPVIDSFPLPPLPL
jgi:hypothetical protein